MENIVIFAVVSVVIIICVFFVILFKIKKRINSSKDLHSEDGPLEDSENEFFENLKGKSSEDLKKILCEDLRNRFLKLELARAELNKSKLELDILKMGFEKRSMVREERKELISEIAISILQSKLKEFGKEKSKQSELN